jgi:hypothetical protein
MEKMLMLLEQRGKARRPKCFKERNMFLHARAITSRHTLMIYKALYITLQTQTLADREPATCLNCGCGRLSKGDTCDYTIQPSHRG